MTLKTHDYVAFFDLDDTILSASSGRLFIEYCHRQGMYSLNDILAGTAIFAGYNLGLLSAGDVVRKWAMSFQGWPVEKLDRLMQQVFESTVKEHIREAARQEVEKHRAENARLVILSASTPFVCEPVKESLNMHDVICTGLETEGNRLTGRLAGDYIYGRYKLVHAHAYCKEHGFDLKEAAYYGDSNADRFVLSGVGQAYCINPGQRLSSLAREKNWQVLNW